MQELLKRAGVESAYGLNTLMILGNHLSKFDGDPITDPYKYKNLLGALQYAIVTRPDIAFSRTK